MFPLILSQFHMMNEFKRLIIMTSKLNKFGFTVYKHIKENVAKYSQLLNIIFIIP